MHRRSLTVLALTLAGLAAFLADRGAGPLRVGIGPLAFRIPAGLPAGIGAPPAGERPPGHAAWEAPALVVVPDAPRPPRSALSEAGASIRVLEIESLDRALVLPGGRLRIHRPPPEAAPLPSRRPRSASG
jgi:hypothetical protein